VAKLIHVMWAFLVIYKPMKTCFGSSKIENVYPDDSTMRLYFVLMKMQIG